MCITIRLKGLPCKVVFWSEYPDLAPTDTHARAVVLVIGADLGPLPLSPPLQYGSSDSRLQYEQSPSYNIPMIATDVCNSRDRAWGRPGHHYFCQGWAVSTRRSEEKKRTTTMMMKAFILLLTFLHLCFGDFALESRSSILGQMTGQIVSYARSRSYEQIRDDLVNVDAFLETYIKIVDGLIADIVSYLDDEGSDNDEEDDDGDTVGECEDDKDGDKAPAQLLDIDEQRATKAHRLLSSIDEDIESVQRVLQDVFSLCRGHHYTSNFLRVLQGRYQTLILLRTSIQETCDILLDVATYN